MLPCGWVLHHFDRCIWICLGGGQAWLFMCQSHMEAPAAAAVGTQTRDEIETQWRGWYGVWILGDYRGCCWFWTRCSERCCGSWHFCTSCQPKQLQPNLAPLPWTVTTKRLLPSNSVCIQQVCLVQIQIHSRQWFGDYCKKLIKELQIQSADSTHHDFFLPCKLPQKYAV